MGNPLFDLLAGGASLPTELIQVMQLIKSGGSPQALINMAAQQNPQMGAALNLLNGKSPQDMEQVCRNLCQQRGLNYDSLYQQAQQIAKQNNL